MGVSTVSDKDNCAPPSRTANVMGETLQCAFADASTRGLFGSDPERPSLLEPERRASVTALKRIFELWAMDADSHAAYLAGPARAHAIVGDAAGRGLCYYATEPLDNPDYECFLVDFHAEFGRVPQTTTAAATRDIERTRRLLRWGQQTFERVLRRMIERYMHETIGLADVFGK